MESTRKLAILFVPRSSIGHINSCIGVAEPLHFCGHQIVFAVDQSFKDYFKKQGFREEIIGKELSSVEQRDPGESIRKLYLQNGLFHDHSELEKVKMWIKCATLTTRYQDEQLAKIILSIKPDVIVVDWFIAPSIFNSGIPWVLSISQQILTLIDDPRTPPRWVGLSADDPSQWAKYRELLKDDFDFMKNKFYHHLFGDEKPFPLDRFIESPYLNIYSYPLELDYIDQRPLPLQPKWYRFDSFIRMEEEKFDLPEKLAQKQGKLIFLSMGSLGSANFQLMKRLIGLIADLPFRFIVSKGKFKKLYYKINNSSFQVFVVINMISPIIVGVIKWFHRQKFYRKLIWSLLMEATTQLQSHFILANR